MSRDDSYALDVLNAARAARSFVSGMTAGQFLADSKTQSAVLYQLTILGEAARRVSDAYRAVHAHVPWPKMAGLRNRIIHEYGRVRLDRVWSVLDEELPELIASLERFVKDHP